MEIILLMGEGWEGAGSYHKAELGLMLLVRA